MMKIEISTGKTDLSKPAICYRYLKCYFSKVGANLVFTLLNDGSQNNWTNTRPAHAGHDAGLIRIDTFITTKAESRARKTRKATR